MDLLWGYNSDLNSDSDDNKPTPRPTSTPQWIPSSNLQETENVIQEKENENDEKETARAQRYDILLIVWMEESEFFIYAVPTEAGYPCLGGFW